MRVRYERDSEWIVRDIDTDLCGFGGSPEEALDDLMDHIRMQASFLADPSQWCTSCCQAEVAASRAPSQAPTYSPSSPA